MLRNSPWSQYRANSSRPGVGAALGDLVLVMREDQVHPAGVDVQDVRPPLLPDQLQRHGRALDVPARAPPPERRVPRRTHGLILRPRRLPEHEVPGVLLGVLVRADPLAGAGLELAAVELREPPVRRELGDREIDRPVVADVRHAAGQQPLDQLDHGADVLGRPRLRVRRADPQPVAILLERPREGIHVRPERHALLTRRGDGPVVHVGQVHDMEDLVAAGLEPAAQKVLEEERPEIADVGVVVDGGTAGVERHPARVERLERLDFPGQRVVEAERHPPLAPATVTTS